MRKSASKTRKRYIIGIDEAGRGPLAGPVSVAAIAIPASFYKKILAQFREAKDSKQLSPKVRKQIFQKIKKQEPGALLFAVSLVGNKIIDKKGIVKAVHIALSRSLKKLGVAARDCEVLLDGSLRAPIEYKKQKTIIRGDQTIRIISMASIIAKVHRDRYMTRKAKEYPNYAFEIHKGYGTSDHIKRIKKYGPSEIHRKSFLKSL